MPQTPTFERCVASLLGPLVLGTLLAGCSAGRAEPMRASRTDSVDLAHCFSAATTGAPANLTRCPPPVAAAIAEAAPLCRDFGGVLVPHEEAEVWALDADGNGSAELAFEINGLVTCENAWSAFSCGSRDCPKTLYEARGGGWREIATLYAGAPERLEVLVEAVGGYRTLRVCADAPACDEQWYYEWQGAEYDRTFIDVRGHRVDFAGSVHGFATFLGDTAVLAEPLPGAAVLDRYGAGVDAVIVGTAEDADYYYVSPCNACGNGFVEKAAVRLD